MNKLLIVAVLFAAVSHANTDPPKTQQDTPAQKSPPALDETIVGESVPMHMEMFYSPAVFCKVDVEANIYSQLSQCKNQRMGWLKI